MSPDQFSIARTLANLKALGWTPGGIVDVGVAAGTPGLYSTWPGAPLCLIEPAPEAMVYMRQIAEKYPEVHIFNFGASDRQGELTGHQLEGLHQAFFGRNTCFPAKSFPMRTCDDMVAEAGLEAPLLLKIDTDSHEREVLGGASATLQRAEVCIFEVNFFHHLRGMISALEVCGLFAERGFALFDIAGFSTGQSGLLRAADFVFVKAESPLFRTALENSSKSADKMAKRISQFQKFKVDNPLI